MQDLLSPRARKKNSKQRPRRRDLAFVAESTAIGEEAGGLLTSLRLSYVARGIMAVGVDRVTSLVLVSGLAELCVHVLGCRTDPPDAVRQLDRLVVLLLPNDVKRVDLEGDDDDVLNGVPKTDL